MANAVRMCRWDATAERKLPADVDGKAIGPREIHYGENRSDGNGYWYDGVGRRPRGWSGASARNGARRASRFCARARRLLYGRPSGLERLASARVQPRPKVRFLERPATGLEQGPQERLAGRKYAARPSLIRDRASTVGSHRKAQVRKRCADLVEGCDDLVGGRQQEELARVARAILQ